MKNLTSKEIRLAENNIGYFNALSPDEKLRALTWTVADDGDYRERLENWKEDTVAGAALTKTRRIEELVYILENEECRNNIERYLTAGMLDILVPELFDGMSDAAREKYWDYISGMKKADCSDPVVYINLFMFPFRHEFITEVFKDTDYDQDTVEWIAEAQRLYPEFMEAKSVRGVRGFVYHYGMEFFEYMKEFAENLYLITGSKKYRPVDSDDTIKKWKANNGPYCMEDLNISDYDVARIAQENGVTKEVMMEILMNYCLKHPEDNHQKILIFVAENAKGAKLKRALKELEKAKQKNFI